MEFAEGLARSLSASLQVRLFARPSGPQRARYENPSRSTPRETAVVSRSMLRDTTIKTAWKEERKATWAGRTDGESGSMDLSRRRGCMQSPRERTRWSLGRNAVTRHPRYENVRLWRTKFRGKAGSTLERARERQSFSPSFLCSFYAGYSVETTCRAMKKYLGSFVRERAFFEFAIYSVLNSASSRRAINSASAFLRLPTWNKCSFFRRKLRNRFSRAKR